MNEKEVLEKLSSFLNKGLNESQQNMPSVIYHLGYLLIILSEKADKRSRTIVRLSWALLAVSFLLLVYTIFFYSIKNII